MPGDEPEVSQDAGDGCWVCANSTTLYKEVGPETREHEGEARDPGLLPFSPKGPKEAASEVTSLSLLP